MTFLKKKIDKNFHFFQKIAIGNFLKKMKNFGNLKKKDKFLAFFKQSNGNFTEGQLSISYMISLRVMYIFTDVVFQHNTERTNLLCSSCYIGKLLKLVYLWIYLFSPSMSVLIIN